MKYSLSNLNASIERDLSVDREYTIEHYKKEFNWIYEMIGNEAPKGGLIDTVYHNYRIGNFLHLENLFTNDHDLISSFFPKEKLEALLLEGEIKRTRNKYRFHNQNIKDTIFKVIKLSITLLELQRKSNEIIPKKTDIKKATKPELKFLELLPDDFNYKQKAYVVNYQDKSASGLAALVVALGLEKIKPNTKLIRALTKQYAVKLTQQNFNDYHLYHYIEAKKKAIISNVRYKEIKKIENALVNLK